MLTLLNWHLYENNYFRNVLFNFATLMKQKSNLQKQKIEKTLMKQKMKIESINFVTIRFDRL